MAFALSTMQLTSSAFEAGGRIPKKHTGEDTDVSPALAWSHAPEGTRSFAVICHDPDAPLVTPDGDYGYTHWVLYNIPADVTSLEEGDPRFTQGIRGNGQPGYMGPMPPPGHGTHRYFFWILAMSSEPNLEAGLTINGLLAKVEPTLLGMNRLVGEYSRD
ncbi:MAG: YbhB/YbcL family Raf kinase inhibitor-like protein [Chloroflexi bacterium]|nr:YbhB/YbcL family Raf kinase inhibitor-like protein [Chloroflexota bacterium]